MPHQAPPQQTRHTVMKVMPPLCKRSLEIAAILRLEIPLVVAPDRIDDTGVVRLVDDVVQAANTLSSIAL